ncbi:MAG: 2,3-bisphosphoglycerate-independent phosphoglycerate mutase [Candidatus Desulfofervidus auxilii]|nr:2,3-bisphosphoglycerate-independent phosphoglycerate mutase [Candidatus Desulfofervidus auxilii]
MGPVVLIILDGWGLNPKKKGNAVALANTPVMDYLMATYPWTTLKAHGEAVGLPEGVMGNSEVGHLNLGAGRIVYQDVTRISKAIKDGNFFKNKILLEAMARAKGKKLHLLGLVSDGQVHSSLDHLYALCKLAKEKGVNQVFIHAFTDGRDTPPKSALKYIEDVEENIKNIGVGKIATVSGRYYAMDRDNRWERIKLAYEAIVLGKGFLAKSAIEAVKNAYERGETDEFIKPTVIISDNKEPIATIDDNDVVIVFNFRADRVREITRALTSKDFSYFPRQKWPFLNYFVCMTEYDIKFNLPVAFPPENLKNILGEVISQQGWKQLRIAETEKYAHVTYFFNGGKEKPFPGEERCLIPSPKEVPTYDLKPEMSAPEVTVEFIKRLKTKKYQFIVLNFANGDMVGHTGVLEAAIKACETVDKCLGEILNEIKRQNGIAFVTADHGNAEEMIDDETGQPHTAHTLNPVPFIIVKDPVPKIKLKSGILGDVAPTILHLIGCSIPQEMTGRCLVVD